MTETPTGLDITLLRSALDTLAEGVTVHDRNGRLLYVNEAGARMLGCETPDEAMAMEPGTWRTQFDIFHEDGTEVDPDELPGRRAFGGATPEPLIIRSIDRETGVARWRRIAATPLFDEQGDVVAAVNAISDVTAVKEAELAQRLLARAGEVLGATLDYEQTLQDVARLAVPELADWCAVDLLDEQGRIEPVALAHADRDRVALGHRLRERYPVDPEAETGLAGVLRTGRVELTENIDDDQLVAVARDDEHLELLRAVGLRHALIVPLGPSQSPIGTLTLVRGGERPFTPGEVELARELARRATTAIENALLYTERTAIAHTLQVGLLPPRLVAPPGYELALLFRPAGAANEVGGDFYDVVQIDGRWLAFVGDVAGKGAAAAAITARARYTIGTVAQLNNDPTEAIRRLNASLLELESRPLCTAACVTVGDGSEDGSATVTCAGHPPPIAVTARGADPVRCGGTLIGAVEDATWNEHRCELAVGDAIVIYTDGVTDAVGEDGRFGLDRLIAALGEGPPVSADDLIRRLTEALGDFQVFSQRDDIAVLVLRRIG